MHFGIDVSNYGRFGDPALLVDLAVETEEAGWDGFYIWDHLHGGGRSQTTDPWIVLAAVATATNRIRIGPMVTPLARRRPHKVARETVALDHLSRGRVVLGVGLGSRSEREFAGFGDAGDPTTRGELLDEGLRVITGLWSGEPFSFEGRHHRVEQTVFRPTPLQEPRIPIWVAGKWPNRRPMRRAARWDGAFPIDRAGDVTSMMSVEATAEAVAYVQRHRSASRPFDFVHAGLLTGDPDIDRQRVREYAEAGVTWWLEHIYPSRMTPAGLRAFIRQGPPPLR
jgi:alkanesulfonate monooxygenase SsuD/methylene tetrahydromethanopterin reductase-like flavin-dependent oxidoreductase (luciferase family)